MTRKQLVLAAAMGSAALLLGAFVFQLLGLPPCKMCIWQRWPHGLAALCGGIFFAQALLGVTSSLITRVALAVGALAALATSLMGFYHAGVEQKLWDGPDSCTTSGSINDLSADQLLDQIMTAPLARCDEIPWEMFGISMAGWNGILSALLAMLWVLALRRHP